MQPDLDLADDLFWSRAFCPAAAVSSVAVVVGEIALEVGGETGRFGNQMAGEGRLPAFVEDGATDALDAAVPLRATSRVL